MVHLVKNQYFSDINDYRKYGLLRLLTSGGKLKTAVCWILMPEGKPTDDKLRPLTSAINYHTILGVPVQLQPGPISGQVHKPDGDFGGRARGPSAEHPTKAWG